jgi:hypothetical protein
MSHPDSATKKGIWLGLHGMAAICVYMDTVTKKFGYAHHYVVDELAMNKLPGDRNPAAKLLTGEPLSKDTATLLQENLMIIDQIFLPGSTKPWSITISIVYQQIGLLFHA